MLDYYILYTDFEISVFWIVSHFFLFYTFTMFVLHFRDYNI